MKTCDRGMNFEHPVRVEAHSLDLVQISPGRLGQRMIMRKSRLDYFTRLIYV